MPPIFDVSITPPSESYRRARRAIRYVSYKLRGGKLEHVRGTGPATVLHISMVGNNAASSRNTAGIFRVFHAVTPLQAVLMEGCTGAMNYSALRGRSLAELDRLLEQGQIAPQLHFAATCGSPVVVYGIEDMALLQEAMNAQRGVFQRQEAVGKYLKQLGGIIAQTTPAGATDAPLPLAQPKKWHKHLTDLLTLGVVYDQWATIEPLLSEFGPGDYEAALARSQPGGAPLPVPDAVREAATHAIRFYQLAVQRGQTFADRALQFLATSGATSVASGVTGFQTTVYLAALERAGVSYLNTRPHLEAEDLGGSANLFELRVNELFSAPPPARDAFTGLGERFNQAMDLIRAKKNDEAIAILRELDSLPWNDKPELRPSALVVAGQLAAALTRARQAPEAWTVMNRARVQYADLMDAPTFVLVAEVASAAGEQTESLAALREATERYTTIDEPDALSRLRTRAASLLEALGQFAAYCVEAEWLAQWYEQQGNADQAGVYHNNFGLAALKLGRVSAALAALNRSVELSRGVCGPGDLGVTLVNRARVLIAGGDVIAAEADLSEADRLVPADDSRRYRLMRAQSRLHHARGERERALELARQIVAVPKAGVTMLNRDDDAAWVRELESRGEQ
jgi:tetratricopeptide (TPR) repeat protein